MKRKKETKNYRPWAWIANEVWKVCNKQRGVYDVGTPLKFNDNWHESAVCFKDSFRKELLTQKALIHPASACFLSPASPKTTGSFV